MRLILIFAPNLYPPIITLTPHFAPSFYGVPPALCFTGLAVMRVLVRVLMAVIPSAQCALTMPAKWIPLVDSVAQAPRAS